LICIILLAPRVLIFFKKHPGFLLIETNFGNSVVVVLVVVIVVVVIVVVVVVVVVGLVVQTHMS